jgi:hypothetical protein
MEASPVPPHRGGISWRTKAGMFGGAATVGGGALYLHHHRRQTVSKYYDPFSGQQVEIAKAEPTFKQKYVYDSRFGLPGQKRGKAERKEVRHAYMSGMPKGAAIGGALAGAGGAKLGGRRGALIGGTIGAIEGSSIGGLIRGTKRRTQIQRRDSFGKTDIPPTGTRYIGALLPTGKHVSHANDFTVAHPKGLKRQTRRSTLQRYTGKG